MEQLSQSANPDEAAAIAAAIARFQVETATPVEEAGEAIGPWQRAALIEGVGAKGAVQKHLEGGSKWLS
jgi:hypothetical protein